MSSTAAACGKGDVYERLRIEADTLISELEDTSTLAAALVEIAIGASSLGSWEHATSAAIHAQAAARERGEADVVFRAETVLAAVQSQRKAEVDSRSRSRLPNAGDELATAIVRRLRVTPTDPE